MLNCLHFPAVITMARRMFANNMKMMVQPSVAYPKPCYYLLFFSAPAALSSGGHLFLYSAKEATLTLTVFYVSSVIICYLSVLQLFFVIKHLTATSTPSLNFNWS